jgi:hypothetical protein
LKNRFLTLETEGLLEEAKERVPTEEVNPKKAPTSP